VVQLLLLGGLWVVLPFVVSGSSGSQQALGITAGLACGALALLIKSTTVTVSGSRISYRAVGRRWHVDCAEAREVALRRDSLSVVDAQGHRRVIPVGIFQRRVALASSLLAAVPASLAGPALVRGLRAMREPFRRAPERS
jgi:hypothetical protein